MSKNSKILNIILVSGVIAVACFGIQSIRAKNIDDSPEKTLDDNLVTIQDNSLIAVSNFATPDIVTQNLNVIVTGYSSCPYETDDTPFITASGKNVRNGIVANNVLPFGTRIRIPELYGDQIFEVQDRMNWRVSGYVIDIWFPSKQEALDFGIKSTYIEILKG